MNRSELAAIVLAAMGRRWCNEAPAAFDTPEHDELRLALSTMAATATRDDLADIGLAALRLLGEYMEALLLAQRDQVLAELAKARGETPPHAAH